MNTAFYKQLVLFSALFFFASLVQAEWQVKYPEQLFVVPGQESVVELEYRTADGHADATVPEARFEIVNTDGQHVSDGVVNQGRAQFTLDQGFYELVVDVPVNKTEANSSQTQQRFGVVSLAPFCTADTATLKNRDPFFCIDAAMSWLVNKTGNRREQLVKIARRSGITMMRERLSWSEIQPTSDKPIQPDGHRGYDSFRKMCAANNIEVLEMFHDAPQWVGKVGKYPDQMNQLAQTWASLYSAWSSTWGGLEVWNEPDIMFSGDLPADQYAPILKTVSWEMTQQGMTKPVLGCCLALFNVDWLDNALENDTLAYCDTFSFHTYKGAQEMRDLYSKFANKVNGGERKVPIWITECGRPWKRGKGRADAKEDKVSAVDIVMKAVMAKTAGCERYFPFVYPYYDEKESNFGMMDKSCSPMRSFAGYAQLIRVLSGYRYCGDVDVKSLFNNKAIAFVSDSSDKAVLVLYTSNVDNATEVQLPFNVLRAERVTGEPVAIKSTENGQSVPVCDGLIYVWTSRTEVEKSAVVASQIAQIPVVPDTSNTVARTARKVTPLVVKYLFDKTIVSPCPIGYRVKHGNEQKFTIKLALDNLSDKPIEAVAYPPLYTPKATSENSVTNSQNNRTLTAQPEQKVTCPAHGRVTVEWTVDLSELCSNKSFKPVSCKVVWDKNPDQPTWETQQQVVIRFAGE